MIEFLNSLLYWFGVEVVSTGKREADLKEAEEIDGLGCSFAINGDYDEDLDWTEDDPEFEGRYGDDVDGWNDGLEETFNLMESCYYDGVDSMTGKVQALSFAVLIGTTLNILLVCYIAASIAANS